MAKTEEIPASNDTLLSLISSLQGLTLALQANMAGTTSQRVPAVTSAQTLALQANMAGTTAQNVPAAASTTGTVTAAVPSTTVPAATAPVAPAVTASVLPAAATPAPPAVATASLSAATAPTNSTPTVAAGGVPPTPPGPTPPLSAVYLTTVALSSQGVHPTVLEALPSIVSAPESGTWFAVTVGHYTGVYSEWPEVSPIVSGWSGACYKKHPTKSAALASYEHAWIRGLVHGGIHPDHHL